MMDTLRDRLAARQELLLDLADQLRAAVQQTEHAVLDISEKFMNIAGRARRQLQATSDIVGSMVQDQQAASGSDVDRTAKVQKLVSTLEGLSAETGMLARTSTASSRRCSTRTSPGRRSKRSSAG
jgi:hypothetical protein